MEHCVVRFRKFEAPPTNSPLDWLIHDRPIPISEAETHMLREMYRGAHVLNTVVFRPVGAELSSRLNPEGSQTLNLARETLLPQRLK